jgi:hypothetical protein
VTGLVAREVLVREERRRGLLEAHVGEEVERDPDQTRGDEDD